MAKIISLSISEQENYVTAPHECPKRIPQQEHCGLVKM